jgi:hypothetical protein
MPGMCGRKPVGAFLVVPKARPARLKRKAPAKGQGREHRSIEYTLQHSHAPWKGARLSLSLNVA